MIPPERQIPFPLESAKNKNNNFEAYQVVRGFLVCLIAIEDEVFSHKLMVGSEFQSENAQCLNPVEAQILFHLVIHYLKRGNPPEVALWNANFMMMWR